tara:strand:+ start:566 stop:799 length:234 start_codon:yes stop_codon:yes gene_type:complete
MPMPHWITFDDELKIYWIDREYVEGEPHPFAAAAPHIPLSGVACMRSMRSNPRKRILPSADPRNAGNLWISATVKGL